MTNFLENDNYDYNYNNHSPAIRYNNYYVYTRVLIIIKANSNPYRISVFVAQHPLKFQRCRAAYRSLAIDTTCVSHARFPRTVEVLLLTLSHSVEKLRSQSWLPSLNIMVGKRKSLR